MSILDKIARSVSLWLMKTAFRGMSDIDKLETRRDAAQRIQDLKVTNDEEDLKVAQLWIEFYNWITTYEEG